MRVYFHLRAKHDSIPDLEGIEVADIEQARVDALDFFCELRKADASTVRSLSGWTLEASDATGRVVFWLDLDKIASVEPPMDTAVRNET